MQKKEEKIRILASPLPAKDSVNYVPTVPKGFEDWVVANKERIARAKSMPYFISDNQKVVDDILNGDYERKKKIAEDRAEYNSYDKTLWKKEFLMNRQVGMP